MAEAKTPRVRKQQVNYAAEHARLAQFARISIQIMTQLQEKLTDHEESHFYLGQVTALKAVLAEMGEKEEAK